jgi:hypothetical protein
MRGVGGGCGVPVIAMGASTSFRDLDVRQLSMQP